MNHQLILLSFFLNISQQIIGICYMAGNMVYQYTDMCTHTHTYSNQYNVIHIFKY